MCIYVYIYICTYRGTACAARYEGTKVDLLQRLTRGAILGQDPSALPCIPFL